MKSAFGLMLRGMAMGVAEVIPGVSGGTIAFITGIYKMLLESIKSVNLDALKFLKSADFGGLWSHLNGRFLMYLLMGMASGIIIGVFGVSHLLEHFPEPLWGFFFGLVLASGIYMARQIDSIKAKHIVLFVLGLVGSFLITQLTPAGGSESLLFVFLSGTIAISALILPGISGSFILLLLGMYSIIIPNVKSVLSDPNSQSLMIVAVFALGCIVGLMTVSRLLSHTFTHYKDATLAVLTGIMIGSLPKIWPWRNPLKIMDKETKSVLTPDLSTFKLSELENIKVLDEAAVLPVSYFSNPHTMLTIAMLIIGFVIILGADLYQRNSNSPH